MTDLEEKNKVLEKITRTVKKLDTLDGNRSKKHEMKKWFVEKRQFMKS